MTIRCLENTDKRGILEKNNLFLKNLFVEEKKKKAKNYLSSGGLEPAILVLLGHSLDHYANERLVGEGSKAYLYKLWLQSMNLIFSGIG